MDNFKKNGINISIFIAVIIFTNLLRCYSSKQFVLGQDFEGRIKEKYNNHDLRGNPEIILEGSTTWYTIRNFHYFGLIEPGDYIIKKRGTTEYLLVKGNDTTIFFCED